MYSHTHAGGDEWGGQRGISGGGGHRRSSVGTVGSEQQMTDHQPLPSEPTRFKTHRKTSICTPTLPDYLAIPACAFACDCGSWVQLSPELKPAHTEEWGQSCSQWKTFTSRLLWPVGLTTNEHRLNTLHICRLLSWLYTWLGKRQQITAWFNTSCLGFPKGDYRISLSDIPPDMITVLADTLILSRLKLAVIDTHCLIYCLVWK